MVLPLWAVYTLWSLGTMAVSAIVSYALRPKPPEPKPAELSDFDIPTAEEGRPIPVVFGTVKVTGANVLWYGGLFTQNITKKQKSAMGTKSKWVTVGYRYGISVHMGVCYGPVDSVEKILASNREAYGIPVMGSSTVRIDQPWLFGGDEKEGGLNGSLQVQMGEPNQTPSPELIKYLGANIPAFRGILGFIYSGLMSANSPYLKPFSFVIRRLIKGWENNQAWYPERASILNPTPKDPNHFDANPAHIIYECLTNTDWGMGYPAASLDDANFRTVADTLYGEGFGLSLMWNQQNTIEVFLGIIFNHMAGSLAIDPQTGLYQIKLIRQDYNVADLPIFDPENITELVSYQRAGWGELINEITLKYTDPDDFTETAATVQNLAVVQVQGSVINQTVTFSGINSHNIAQRVAQRELIAKSSPLAKVQFKVNRHAWQLMPGDVFVWVWPKYGVSSLIMRVASIGTGTLENGMITVDAVEDVYGLPNSSYTKQQDSGWTDPLQNPTPSPNRLFTEATYHDLVIALSPADLSYAGATKSYPVMYASSPSVASFDYELLLAAHGTGSFNQVDQQSHTAIGTILNSLPIEEFSSITISTVSADEIMIGEYGIIGSEYVRIDSFNQTTGAMTLTRGILDTVPQAHAANSIIYFAEGNEAIDPTPWTLGAVVDAKVITATGKGVLDPMLAPIDTITIKARHNKPYPPGKFRINGQYRPETVEDAFTLSWVHRNRISQGVGILSQTDSAVPFETGTTYTIKIYNQLNALCRTLTGITDNSYTYPIEDELADCGGEQDKITVELLAVRDDVESWQAQRHTFNRLYGDYNLQDFDYAVIRYIWTTEDGRDLDTRTFVSNPSRNVMVGWSKATTDEAYLSWGGDNTGSGVEAVLLDLKQLIADSSSHDVFEIMMNMFWFGEPVGGNFQIQFESYKGGTMSQSGFDFINTGGVVVQNLVIDRQSNNRIPTGVNGSEYDGVTVAKLTFNPATQTGVLSKVG